MSDMNNERMKYATYSMASYGCNVGDDMINGMCVYFGTDMLVDD